MSDYYSTIFNGHCFTHGQWMRSDGVWACPWCQPSWTPAAPLPPTIWPAIVPAVCPGSGYPALPDYSTADGECGICGQRVRIDSSARCTTHKYEPRTIAGSATGNAGERDGAAGSGPSEVDASDRAAAAEGKATP